VHTHTGDKVEYNTVDFDESRLLPKLATKSTATVYVQLCCRFWQQSTFYKVDRVEFNFVASVSMYLT